MKAVQTFSIASLNQEPQEGLLFLARNLRWTWDDATRDLFRSVDPEAWEAARHDPVQMLSLVGAQRLRALAGDATFLEALATAQSRLESYMTGPRWYQKLHNGTSIETVAYFSPEFGVSEVLPVYSGGLGVLAGDHLKVASDLGVPFVGVGLLYRHGYFRQELARDGWQGESYPVMNPDIMPLARQIDAHGETLTIDVELAGRNCSAQIWRAQIGRVALLLLDTDVESNASEERSVTDRLYGGDKEHRLRQEIILGIGGVRALRATGYAPNVWHSNEGHAGFLGLERIRELVAGAGLSFDEALEAVRASTVFTTHTPVPAGIDIFDVELMRRYFDSFADECGVSFDDFMQLGGSPRSVLPSSRPAEFNMAVMGFNLSGRANAVSELHGEVSRDMFSRLWRDVPTDEVPIGSITNGVHVGTWLGREVKELLGVSDDGSGTRWDRASQLPDDVLWEARGRARSSLVSFARRRLRAQLLRRGESSGALDWVDDALDPSILTIGFARRFAQYKRATLLLRDPERLTRLLLSDTPVQIIMAGKAHPHDDGGKEFIRRIVGFASDPSVRHRFVFLEDYDMEVGRALTRGVDVWLNHPRRPLEACGTSGMKAAINGGINCSVLDGWWDELYHPDNGWAIGTRLSHSDPDEADSADADAVAELLEKEVTPLFYDRSAGGVPVEWVTRMKASMAGLGPAVSAERMLEDYVDSLYEPSARHGRRMTADGYARARALAAWKSKLRSAWTDVAVLAVSGDGAGPGTVPIIVHAHLVVGSLSPGDVLVELAHGPVDARGELVAPGRVTMARAGFTGGKQVFQGSFTPSTSGLYGYTVRALPSHPDLTSDVDLGLVAWAQAAAESL